MSRITLSTGKQIEVLAVPPFVLNDAQRAVADLPPAERERALRSVAWLVALPGVTVPDDWQFPRGLRLVGITPRAGEDGMLLDYIEYGLLATPQDIAAVQGVMYQGELSEEEVASAEATFPSHSRQATSAAHPGGAG